MDDVGSSIFKKIILTLIPIILFISVAYVGYEMLIHTPAGKGLNKLMGGVGAVLGMAGKQLTTCADKGFFNVAAGCWLGVAGVVILIAWGACGILQYFKEPINARLKFIMQRTNKTQGEVANDILTKAGGPDAVNDMVKNLDPEVAEAAVARAYNNALSTMVQEEISTDPNSPVNIQMKPVNTAEWTQFNQSNDNDLDPADIAESNQTGDEIFPTPEGF